MSTIEDFLDHHGVKGMKWGTRRKRGPDGRVSSEGKRADHILTKAKTQGKKSLTNKELADLNKRLQLEKSFDQLTTKPKVNKVKDGEKKVKEIIALGTTLSALAATPHGQRAVRAGKNAMVATIIRSTK